MGICGTSLAPNATVTCAGTGFRADADTTGGTLSPLPGATPLPPFPGPVPAPPLPGATPDPDPGAE